MKYEIIKINETNLVVDVKGGASRIGQSDKKDIILVELNIGESEHFRGSSLKS